MYNPIVHQELRPEVLYDLIRSHPLASLVIQTEDGFTVDHIPMMIAPEQGPHGTLRAHVARANPLWQQTSVRCVAIFQGAQAYISPNWYPSKHESGKAVPTWNYVVVHAHGQLRINDQRDWKRQLVSDLTDQHEQGRYLPWQVSDAPEDYLNTMLDMIVGIEIPIERLEGKWKTSQNRQTSDRIGVIGGLKTDPKGLAMAQWVEKTLDDDKGKP